MLDSLTIHLPDRTAMRLVKQARKYLCTRKVCETDQYFTCNSEEGTFGNNCLK